MSALRRIGVRCVLGAFLVGGCSTERTLQSLPAAPTLDPGVVVIEAGLTPRMRPDDVAAIAFRQIAAMESMAGRVVAAPRIWRLTATTAAGIVRLEPGAGQGDPMPEGINWLVRAEGTFTTNRGPVGGAAGVAASGFFIISDANGDILGFGYP